VDAFAGDKILLLGLAAKVKDTTQYTLLDDDLGFEPYAIAMPRGDSDFRLAVNRALAQIYGSGAIVDIFHSTFGPNIEPTPALVIMYDLATYPE
jgi:glutamate/aspartate transport system substrate-binding protein